MPQHPSNPQKYPPLYRKNIIITGSDSRYFPLLQELIESVRRFPQYADIPFGCIDGGLTQQQIHILSSQNVIIKKPYIPQEVPFKHLKKRPNLGINLSKLWLNILFPEYDTLLWLDADVWIQKESALNLIFDAAVHTPSSLAIVPELFHHKPFRVRWTPFNLAQIRSILYKNATLARLPTKIRRIIGVRPTLNAGVFCLPQRAPHWQIFQKWHRRVLKYGKPFCSDQLSIALGIYIDHLPLRLLPSTCNYLGPWHWNSTSNMICEQTYPHNPAGIIHLAGYDAMRLNPLATTKVLNEHHKTQDMNLRFTTLHKK